MPGLAFDRQGHRLGRGGGSAPSPPPPSPLPLQADLVYALVLGKAHSPIKLCPMNFSPQIILYEKLSPQTAFLHCLSVGDIAPQHYHVGHLLPPPHHFLLTTRVHMHSQLRGMQIQHMCCYSSAVLICLVKQEKVRTQFTSLGQLMRLIMSPKEGIDFTHLSSLDSLEQNPLR